MSEITYCRGKADYKDVRLFQNSDTTHCRRAETAESTELHQYIPTEWASKNNCCEDPFLKTGDAGMVEHNELWILSTSLSAISMIIFIFNSTNVLEQCFGITRSVTNIYW